MALVSTGGLSNCESDFALGNAASLTLTRIAVGGNPVTIDRITLNPLSTAAGTFCGYAALADSVIGEIARYYVTASATAASQSSGSTFPVGVTFVPQGTVTLTYNQVTNAGTAAVSVIWRSGG